MYLKYSQTIETVFSLEIIEYCSAYSIANTVRSYVKRAQQVLWLAKAPIHTCRGIISVDYNS